MSQSESSESSEPPGAGSRGPGDVTGRTADRPSAATDPGRGRRIAIDVGTVRVGVAACDPDGILATPVETVQRAGAKRGRGARGDGAADLARIAEIVREYEAVEVIVGLPRTLRGANGASAELAISFADRLRSMIPGVPIRLSDERLTTVSAARALRDSGVRARGQRQMIDQAAAVSILQGWLDERSAVLKAAGEQSAGWSDE
ncbi:Holliday junction resolvase RuvX [Nocardia wallacei]|uniref:Putative pre-16S rRNA nuclease n=1 Tax=Nocardia wallacei TaxID=480035 RepID=A0A7G1KLX0_9NOCA|nr:putative pre-16S rRNA nuclease [Nocardia wallacei]